MVRIEKDRLVIEIKDSWPADRWLEMMRDLVTLVGAVDKERVESCRDSVYGVCDLMMELLPDEQDARKMIRG